MKKKLITLLLAGSMIVTSLAGCGKNADVSNTSESTKETSAVTETSSTAGEEEKANFNPEGYPIVNEQVAISIMLRIDDANNPIPADEMPAIQRLEEQTGVDLQIEFVKDSDWKTKFNLMVASEEYPDIIIASGDGKVDYEEYGVIQQILLPLDELIDKYMPNYTERVAKEENDPTLGLVASDGRTYAVGHTIGNDYALKGFPVFVNQTWLDALKLKTPTNIEELTDVLRAFKTGDPNGNGKADEIPFVINLSSGNIEMVQLFGVAAQEANTWVFVDDNKKIQLVPTQEGFRECMEWMHLCYEEGLLDPEVFSMDKTAFRAKLNTGNAGLFFAGRLHNYSIDGIIDDAVVWVPGNTARFAKSYGLAVPSAFITNQCEQPEVAARVLNAFLEKETMFSLYWGEQDAKDAPGWSYNEDGTASNYQIENSSSLYNGMSYIGVNTLVFMPNETNAEFWKTGINVSERKAFCNAIKDGGGVQKYSNDLLNLLRLTNEESSKIAQVETDVVSAVKEYTATFIKDGVTDQSWEAFVKIFDAMGVEEAIEIYQKALDNLDF